MPGKLRIPLLIVISTLLAGAIFFGFYSGDENIDAASTGYNASSKGLFGWDYSFSEHTFASDGEGYRAVIIDSGRELRRGRLTAEIILCCGLGFGATFGTWFSLKSLRTTGEQGGGADAEPAV